MMNVSSRQKGTLAESKACEYLINNGFCVVTRNYYTRYGEIDIVAMKDSIYHFIEVKSGDKINPLLNVTPKKLDRIYKTISLYIADNELNAPYCVDIITVRKNDIAFYGNVSIDA